MDSANHSRPTEQSEETVYQLINVIEADRLCLTTTNMNSEEKSRVAPFSTSGFVVCKLKRQQQENQYEIIHVAFEVETSFCIRLPRYMNVKYTALHARQLCDTLFRKYSRCELFQSTPLVGYTKHSRDSDLKQPQKIDYVRVYFRDAKQTRMHFSRMKNNIRPGERNRSNDELFGKLLSRWGVPVSNHCYLEKVAFSAHHFLSLSDAFYAQINTLLDQKAPNLLSIDSYMTFKKKLPFLKQGIQFANSSKNALIYHRNINEYLSKVENQTKKVPLKIISIDIEQYGDKTAAGNRKFPVLYDHKHFISHIGVSVKEGASIQNLCFCYGHHFLSKEHKEVCPDLKLICCSDECSMLYKFFVFLRDSQLDIMSGYNISSYDCRVLFCKYYLYILCKQMSFQDFDEMVQVAEKKFKQYAAIQEDENLKPSQKMKAIQKLFTIKSNEYLECIRAPQRWLVARQCKSKTKSITIESYRYFRSCGLEFDLNNGLYCCELTSNKLLYNERVFNTNAFRDLQLQMFDTDSSGWGCLCGFYYMKKSQFRLNSYKLKDVMKFFFPAEEDAQKYDLPYETMFQYLENKVPEQMGTVAVYCSKDASIIHDLFTKLNIIVELRESSALIRTSFAVNTTCGVQKKINNKIEELCWEHQFVINEYDRRQSPGKYQGATVVVPKPGVYNCVGTLDFASLYPSIIQFKNVCYSTLIEDENIVDPRLDTVSITSGLGTVRFVQNFEGLIPRLERQLLAARRAVKKEMKTYPKSDFRYNVLDARQLAIKVLCNSVYGYMGTTVGRMPKKVLAASITAAGRQIIDQTINESKRLGFETIYGDTGT